MIGHPITLQELEKRVEAHKPGWLERARERTDRMRELGRYEESSSIWSEIKPVYVDLQHGKCVLRAPARG